MYTFIKDCTNEIDFCPAVKRGFSFFLRSLSFCLSLCGSILGQINGFICRKGITIPPMDDKRK